MDQFDKLCTANWIDSVKCGDQVMAELGLQKINLQGSPSEIMDEWKI